MSFKLNQKKTLVLVLILAGFLVSSSSIARAISFPSGERLTFLVKWASMPAGEAVLETLPPKKVNGSLLQHFSLTTRTYEFADRFYKVRDRIDSYTDPEMRHSVLYKKRQSGKRKRDVVVNLDWEKRQASYCETGETRDPIPLLPGAFDPLSALYALRSRELKVNSILEIPVTDGKKCTIGRALVIRKEQITVQGSTFEAFLVELELDQIGGVIAKSRDPKLQIWVTADDRRIPIKFKGKVAVGNFTGELVSMELPNPQG